MSSDSSRTDSPERAPEAHKLPSRPDLDQYRKQSKDLLRSHRAGDESAISRFRASHPKYRRAAPDEIRGARLVLADAQLVVARELGLPSWVRLKAHVAGLLSGEIQAAKGDYFWYADQAGRAVTQLRDGGATAFDRARRWHPGLSAATDTELSTRDFDIDDGRAIVAREQGFDSWPDFVQHLESLGKDAHEFATAHPADASAEEESFADAVRAIQLGRVDDLRDLLVAAPDLLRQSGEEGYTLLLLATQERSAALVGLLLERGADPNQPNDQGWTPLHQAAYGEPPESQDAGQADSLQVMELLLAAGARSDSESRGSGGTPLLQSLFWGHRSLAERLAREGVAPDNLRTAAGLGRVDRIASFFDAAGQLRSEAGESRGYASPHAGFPDPNPSDDPAEVLADALVYAAANGRLEAVDALLDRGADPNAAPSQETALFGAVRCGRADVVRRLLERGADVNARGDWASMTKLTALHHAASVARLDMARLLVEAGADLEARDEVASGTPANWAAHFGNPDIERYLAQVAASPSR